MEPSSGGGPGGGCLGDLGYYCIRAVLWGLAEVPTSVFVAARYHEGVELNLSALLWFEGEKIASLDCGYDSSYRCWFEVSGTEGSIVCDRFVSPKSEESAPYYVHGNWDETREEAKQCIQEVRMIEHLSELARIGEQDDQWPRLAVDTMRVLDAVRLSARDRRPAPVAD